MVGLVAARFEQDADANPVPVVWLDAQDLVGPRSAEECGAAPLYLRGARLIERNICDRRLAVGSLLPTEHELSSSLKVSRQTVRHAIAHLRDQGTAVRPQGCRNPGHASRRRRGLWPSRGRTRLPAGAAMASIRWAALPCTRPRLPSAGRRFISMGGSRRSFAPSTSCVPRFSSWSRIRLATDRRAQAGYPRRRDRRGEGADPRLQGGRSRTPDHTPLQRRGRTPPADLAHVAAR
jgi:hypothetical protein